MTAQEFGKLDIDERANLLWDKGEFISYCSHSNQTIALYAFSKMYVELFYTNLDNEILKIEIMSDWKRLNQYLDSIHIVELL